MIARTPRVQAAPAPNPATAPHVDRAETPARPATQTAPQPETEPYLDPAVVAERLRKGREAEHATSQPPPGIAPRAAPGYFRSYEQVKAAMLDLQTEFPDLVQVLDIGDSSEKVAGKADRDVLVLRLTNRQAQGEKPAAVHLAGEHAREIANPELVMRYATQLVEGFGHDADATALLNTRTIDIVPMMNPDGHAVVERGFAKTGGDTWHRKNTSPPDGVDLNRNYEFRWGGKGSSSDPGSDTYRGPSAASEPEVQAIQQHLAATKPGIFVDWHSYSRLNLFPWGDTHEKAPDFEGLDAVARKFSTFNHYTPMQSVNLYPTNGTSKDFAYGQLGIPGFTVETGDDFNQSDREFEATWRENAPVLGYANKIADAPFERVKGPDVLDVNMTIGGGSPGVAPGTGLLVANVTDATNGKQAIRGAEYVLDPRSKPGTGTALAAADGAFDGPSELVRGTVAQPATAPDLIYVRAQDAAGNWGPLTAQWLKGAPTP